MRATFSPLLLSSTLLAGTFTVDPSGSGPRNYVNVAAAVTDLLQKGVAAPVILDIAAGTYAEQLIIPPFPGGSKTNTVTFRGSASGRTVFGMASNASNLIETGFIKVRPEGLRFERIHFQGNTQQRSYVRLVGDHIQLIDCDLDTIEAYLYGAEMRIQGCRFTKLRRTTYLYGRGGGEFSGNYVAWDQNSSDAMRIYGGWGNPQPLRVFNNVLRPDNRHHILLSEDIEFHHNTVVKRSDAYNKSCLRLQTSFLYNPVVRNNIIANTAHGYLVRVEGKIGMGYLELDNNLYFAGTKASAFQLLNQGFTTLASWRNSTGLDSSSLVADPVFVTSSPAALAFKLGQASPAIGKAVSTPSYIKVDFEGKPRRSPASLGAFRGPRVSTMTYFGAGCPGSGNIVPVIGHSGLVALGSKDFTVTLDKALGGLTVQAFMALGVQQTKISFGGSCDLLVNPQILLQTNVPGSGPGTGNAAFKIPIANNPAWIGLKVHFQWAVADTAAAGVGLATTQGATLEL